nr:ribonuclease H-like domain-containing protein [Tanacetum cinerariifolium]
MAFISLAKHSSGNEEVNIASVSTASTNVSTASANIGVASISQDTACAYIASQSSGLPEAKTEEGETTTDKGLKLKNRLQRQALLKFALMAKTSAESEVFENSLCSKAWLAQVEARLVEHGNQELKYCKKIRVLEFKTKSRANCIESITKDLELLKKEKGELETKLTGFQTASKDLDSLLKSQRLDTNKEGLGYSAIPPPPGQVYSPPKKDLSWKGLPEFADDTVTDYSRPAPPIESSPDDAQNRNPSVTKTEASPSTISPKSFIKFVKATNMSTETKTAKVETAKLAVKYAAMYSKPSKSSNGSSQNNIDDKGYWDSGCSRHITGNISYLSDYEPFDGGYVSFGQGGCKITSKGTIKTGKLEFKNVYFVKDLKDFKLLDNANVLLRTPRKHNMYSIDLNNIVPHKDLTCLVAKASADKGMLWHRRLSHLNFKTMNRLVAQGHTQEEGIDYDEVFAPITRIEAIRLFLAYASFMGFTVYQMDDLEFPARVYKVEKAMYGLHQAPRAWYGTLSKYLSTNGFQRVKRIFRYIKGHPKLGLWYPKESPFDLVAYSDSDYGGATQDHKSTTEGCQFLGRRLISWQCKKQTIMATSTTKAEYVAATSCCRQVRLCMSCKALSREISSSILRLYALTFKPTVYVSYIRQFWSTARIETTKEGTKILATIDGNLRTVSESSIRRNLKLNDEAGISPSYSGRIVPLFDSMLTPQGEGSGIPTEPHHTPSLEAQKTSPTTHSSPTLPPVTTAPIPTVTPSDTPHLRQYTKRARIAQSSALPPVADEHASPLRDVNQGEACPTISSSDAEQDRANMAKTSTLSHELTSRELEITMLKARVKLLEDREGGVAERSGDDAPIKGRSLDEEEEVAEKGSNDTEEIINVLTSMGATTVLSSGVVEIPSGSGSIHTASPSATVVPTGSDVVPTAGLIFATTIVVTPYTRRKGKEKMIKSKTPKKKKIQEQIDSEIASIHAEEELQMMINSLDRSNETVVKYLQEYEQIPKDLFIGERIELISDLIKCQEIEAQRMNEQISRDAKIARIHAEEELQIMIDRLDRSNETVAKSQEYHQFATELPIERRIELISDLVKYQDNYAKVHKYQSQQRKPLTKKQQREFYTSVLRNQAGWKAKDFKGMTLEEIKGNFDLVIVGNKMHKAFPLPVIEFPLPREVPTASEESSYCQKKRDAIAEKIALLLKSRSICQSNSYDS